MTNFQRGLDPKDAMGIGETSQIKDWLIKNNSGSAEFNVKVKDSKVIVTVKGNLVLENLLIEKMVKDKGFKGIEYINKVGHITILNQLSKEDLYSRIKNYYMKVLENCLGKTNEEQQIFLFGEANRIIGNKYIKIIRSLGENTIKESEKYIRGLPINVPIDKEIKDLVKKILSSKEIGNLEYAFHSKDEYCVEMQKYAKRLLEIITY
jgi:hypothetical protein